MPHQSSSHNQKSSDASVIRRRKRNKKISDTIIIAIIGALSTIITTIIVGFLGFGPFARLVEQQWFPSPTPTNVVFIPSDTPTSTAIPSATFTDTPFVVVTLTPSETPTPSPTSTETLIPPQMVVVLRANKYGGETPLNVQFSAEGSYVVSADGTRSYCTHSSCTFTWEVTYVSNQQVVATPRPWRETFAYTFYREGLYYINVTVCQGVICGSGRTQVEGR